MRYNYATGFKTQESAYEYLENLYASDEVSEGEKPIIEHYKVWSKESGAYQYRWKITLEH